MKCLYRIPGLLLAFVCVLTHKLTNTITFGMDFSNLFLKFMDSNVYWLFLLFLDGKFCLAICASQRNQTVSSSRPWLRAATVVLVEYEQTAVLLMSRNTVATSCNFMTADNINFPFICRLPLVKFKSVSEALLHQLTQQQFNDNAVPFQPNNMSCTKTNFFGRRTNYSLLRTCCCVFTSTV